MLDAKSPPAARIGAANAILDRGYGKPWQAVDLGAQATEQNDYSRLTDEELADLARLLAKVEIRPIPQEVEALRAASY